MIFNVSDLWPESAEKLGVITNRFFLNMATKLEEFLYRKSFFITGQTKGIVKDIQRRFPAKKVHWLPNGVDDSIFSAQLNSDWRKENGYSEDEFLILYAGIIGLAQGLDIILDAAKQLPASTNIRFLLLGEGPEKERLQEKMSTENIPNVHFLPLVSRKEIPAIVSSIDAAVIPLRKMDLFLGAIPSKIFENLALKKPILLAVDGEAKELFIEQGKCGLYISPENHQQLASAAIQLAENPELCKTLGENGYSYVRSHFMRSAITQQFIRAYEETLSSSDNK